MAKFYLRAISLALIVALCIQSPLSSGISIDAVAKEKVKKVKPPKYKHRPNLSYSPNVSRNEAKYAGVLGVLGLRDKRHMAFYGGDDGYFSEPVLETLSNALYLEVKAGRAFEQVKNLSNIPIQSFTRKNIANMAKQEGLDYVFVADLTHFNLLREKMVKGKKGLDFKINIRFGIVGQLIDAKTGAVLWAEPIQREDGALNTDKRVTAEDYGSSAINAVQNGFDDMKRSLRELGLEVK